jgi:CheY-like chemotaxis protein
MKRVLVIDDDEDARQELVELFVGIGLEVVSVRDGREGLKALANGRFDVIVTDILMPNVEGLEFITMIKKNSPDTKIIAVSGGGTTRNMSFLEFAEKLGADRTLEKPIRCEQLLANVKELIGAAASA